MNLAYLAGIIDGEGCIGFTKSRGNLIPRLTVTNTDQDLIHDLKEKFGGYVLIRKAHQPNWKPSSHWCICNKKSIELLAKIHKYLRVKDRQAVCLFLHDAIRPGIGQRWTKEGLDACGLLEQQIKWLNKKGPNNQVEPMKLALQG